MSVEADEAGEPDYGIDAPGVRRAMLSAGVSGMIGAIATGYVSRRTERFGGAGPLLIGAAALMGVYGLGMGAYMTRLSRVGKVRSAERLLDLADELKKWTGAEQVLDVGCGRGLMMIGAARRLTTGTAVGVDVWRKEDQADNGPAAALENAGIARVLDRVRVETGDARALPFDDASFDVVLSHWVVHNLPTDADRARALDKMLRVLRPGGTMIVADIAHHDAYRDHLKASGLTIVHEPTGGFESRASGVLSFGSSRPQAIIGRRDT